MNSITTPGAAANPPALSTTALSWGRRREWVLCAALLAIWFAATAWLRPLAIPDEGRYSGVAWEMLRSGNWWVPTLNGHPFFHKPPLFYWLTAASMDLFGVGVWSARLGSVVAASAAGTALFGFVRRWADARVARAAVVVLATTPLFYGGAQYANLDMLVAALVTAAILLAAHACLLLEAGQAHRRPLLLAFAAAAGGVLAKGLIGMVLPTLVLVVWAAMTGRTRRVLGLLLSLPGWLTFLALASPWFLAMQWRFPDFAHYFFIIQHVQRFLSRSFNNPQPVWFYPVVLLVAALPWSPWLLALRRGSRRVPPVQRDVRALMWAWLVVVTAFFSIPASKLVGYILPALPPLAFLVAEAVQRAVSRGTQPGSAAVWLQRTSLGLAAAGCVGITLAAHFYQPKSLASLAARLQAGAAPGDPVVFLKTYPYDVPFYARLRAPVVVVDAWAPADVAKDSWRRELRDAEVFSPGTSRRLLTFAELDRLVCGPATTWLVGPWPSGPETPWLASSEPIYREGRFALWQITPAHLPPILAGRCGHVGEGSP